MKIFFCLLWYYEGNLIGPLKFEPHVSFMRAYIIVGLSVGSFFVLNVFIFVIQIMDVKEILIIIPHSFLNKSIDIVMDHCHKRNPMDFRVVYYCV